MECELNVEATDPGLRALRADFCRVVGRWRLTQAEVRSLLGLEEPPVPVVHPADLSPEAERRAGLVVAIDRGLGVLLGDLDRIGQWLRTPARPFDGRTPLDAMLDLDALVALGRVTELYPDGDPFGGGSA